MQRPGSHGEPENVTPDTIAPDDNAGVLNEKDAHRILVEWNRTAQAYDPTETVWSLVEKQARAHPQRTAVIDGRTEIDYARLTTRANAIASELAARGIAPGALVGVCMRRTWELVATLLGVLRAGCAYVPLDPEYPRERVRYMLAHSRAAATLIDSDKSAELCAGAPSLVRLDQIAERTPQTMALPSARDLAYVIYTSGSTGHPKGVAVEHRSVVAMTVAMRELLDDGELTGVLAAASVCFDPSVMEVLGTLALGGTVVLAENALALPDLPAADRVRTVIMVPSAMQALLATAGLPAGVRCVVLGGEALKRALVERLHALQPPPRVVNVYGPTEDTVYSTAAEVRPGIDTITLGKPVANTRAYILGDAMQPLAVGMPGELYLTGDHLARGYLHDEARTRQRFVEMAPDGPIPERRAYRTGDLCRWTHDGEIEFLGRVDHQVKLRGFRIELEEIESALASMRGVDGAAAAVVEVGSKPMLVGYVASRDVAVTNDACRAYLAERLPKYMLPQVVMRLERLPALPNGKLDRGQLPSPEASRRHEEDEHLPSPSAIPASGDAGGLPHSLAGLSKDERHAALLSIVSGEIARFLRFPDTEQVRPHLALEALGLDSLDRVELSHRLSRTLGHKLPASILVEHATPAAVADHLLGLLASDATEHRPIGNAHDRAPDTLGRLQGQLQSGHPPFMAANAPAWSATHKGTLIRELKRLILRSGWDPYNKVLRTGSAHTGIVADAHTGEAREAVIWTTNLYLGLNRDSEVIEEARSALKRLGTGMGISATGSGQTDLHLAFEKEFAELVGKPAACLFPTGFTTSLGVVAGIVGDGDLVVMDQLCHASIVDGARLSGATVRTFQHNDPADLQSILEAEASPYRTTLVVLESVYSMGEGTAPIRDIVRVAKRHGALVLVDEAHSFGFYGRGGAGFCASEGVADQVDFIMTTLSKALGSLGGVVAAQEHHIALLRASARAYIFQANITPADIAAALAALRRLRTDDALRARLWDNTAYMRKRFSDAGYDLGTGDGPIITPHFPDSDTLYATARGLYARGIHAAAVTYPIVERGRGRLRFICSAAHTREDIDRTLAALVDAHREAESARRAAASENSSKAPLPADGHGDAQNAPGASDEGARGCRHPRRSDVEAWAEGFARDIEDALATVAGPTPDVAVAIRLPDDAEPIMLRIDGRNAAPGDPKRADAPSCSLLFTDDRTVSALCASDVQGLLDSCLQGSCVLSGEAEPFVWLIGRMADHRSQEAEPR